MRDAPALLIGLMLLICVLAVARNRNATRVATSPYVYVRARVAHRLGRDPRVVDVGALVMILALAMLVGAFLLVHSRTRSYPLSVGSGSPLSGSSVRCGNVNPVHVGGYMWADGEDWQGSETGMFYIARSPLWGVSHVAVFVGTDGRHHQFTRERFDDLECVLP